MSEMGIMSDSNIVMPIPNFDFRDMGYEIITGNEDVENKNDNRGDGIYDVPGLSNENVKKEEVSVEGIDFKSGLLSIAKSGFFDLSEDDGIDDGKGNVISFKDLSIDNLDDFISTLVSFLSDAKSEMLKDKVDVSELSDFSKKLIELDKNGGDAIGHLLKYYSNQKPLTDMPLDTKEQKIEFLRKYYTSSGMGNKANVLVRGLMAEGDDAIDSEVEQVVSSLKDMHIKEAEKEREAIENERKAIQEAEKKRKKDVKESLQNNYQLNESLIKKISDFSVEKGDSNHYKIFERVLEFMNDPAKLADLCVFLVDSDEFIKQKTVEVRSGEVRKIHKILKNRTNRSSISESQDDEETNGIIPIDESMITSGRI